MRSPNHCCGVIPSSTATRRALVLTPTRLADSQASTLAFYQRLRGANRERHFDVRAKSVYHSRSALVSESDSDSGSNPVRHVAQNFELWLTVIGHPLAGLQITAKRLNYAGNTLTWISSSSAELTSTERSTR